MCVCWFSTVWMTLRGADQLKGMLRNARLKSSLACTAKVLAKRAAAASERTTHWGASFMWIFIIFQYYYSYLLLISAIWLNLAFFLLAPFEFQFIKHTETQFCFRPFDSPVHGCAHGRQRCSGPVLFDILSRCVANLYWRCSVRKLAKWCFVRFRRLLHT